MDIRIRHPDFLPFLKAPAGHALLLDHANKINYLSISEEISITGLSPKEREQNRRAAAQFQYLMEGAYPGIEFPSFDRIADTNVPFQAEDIRAACTRVGLERFIVEKRGLPATKRRRLSLLPTDSQNPELRSMIFNVVWKQLFLFVSLSVPDEYTIDIELNQPQPNSNKATHNDLSFPFGSLVSRIEMNLSGSNQDKQSSLVAILRDFLEEENVASTNSIRPDIWEQPLHHARTILEALKTMPWEDSIKSYFVFTPPKTIYKNKINKNQTTRILTTTYRQIPDPDWELIKPLLQQDYASIFSNRTEFEVRTSLGILFHLRCQGKSGWPKLKLSGIEPTDGAGYGTTYLKAVQGRTFISVNDLYVKLIEGNRQRDDCMNKLYRHISQQDPSVSEYLHDVMRNFSMNKKYALFRDDIYHTDSDSSISDNGEDVQSSTRNASSSQQNSSTFPLSSLLESCSVS